MFVSGTLANYDQRPLGAAHARATVLATGGGGSGIARIEASVDGKRVASRRVHCRSSCPASARLSFTYDRSRFGPGDHTVRITAVDGAGKSEDQAIAIKRKSSVRLKGAPDPQPAFYLTANSLGDLRRQAAADAARFARSQASPESVLVLDFGAARHRGSQYGSALRSGHFFTSHQIGSALEAAARGYKQGYRRGSVTIVYANSNALLGQPRHGYTPLNAKTAREAGRQQARTVRGVRLFAHESAAPGGDIEPGYDLIAPIEISLALVDGASKGAGHYFDLGTAPCTGNSCTHGWTVRDICAVTTGDGRQAVPEIYYGPPNNQSAEWAAIAKKCAIKSFAGASASRLGDFKPAQSWRLLGQGSGRKVGEALLVFPR